MSEKQLFLLSLVLTVAIVAIPSLFVVFSDSIQEGEKDSAMKVKVYLTKEDRVVELPLSDYVRGVVASEMPADFHKEALKAQSLTARTYIVKRLREKDFSDMKKWGDKAAKAHVSDTVTHQVYKTDQHLKQQWGQEYEQKRQRIAEAVHSTESNIITYDGQPISALFFSTSNGWTENAKDYFGGSQPYLQSVVSTWDQQSPKYRAETTIPLKEAVKRLEEETGKPIAETAFNDGRGMKVIDRTEGKNIAKMQIGDQVFTGREVREALDLRSSDFQWVVKNEKQLHITTFGFGHGVGMSQWGANLLAKKGKSFMQIIHHYYQGTTIESIKK